MIHKSESGKMICCEDCSDKFSSVLISEHFSPHFIVILSQCYEEGRESSTWINVSIDDATEIGRHLISLAEKANATS